MNIQRTKQTCHIADNDEAMVNNCFYATDKEIAENVAVSFGNTLSSYFNWKVTRLLEGGSATVSLSKD